MTGETRFPNPFHQLLQINPDEISSLVDAGMEIKGEVRNNTSRTMLISGTVYGTVVSKGPVIINEGAEVHGSIQALSLQLAGTVKRRNDQDRLVIAGPMVVAKTAHLGCDVECEGVQTELGAFIDGAIRPRAPAGGVRPSEVQRAPQPAVAVAPVAFPPVQAQPSPHLPEVRRDAPAGSEVHEG